MFFNTDCEHCQYEATEIQKNIKQFIEAELVFISIEPLEKIKTFAEKYKLTAYKNVTFGHLDATEVSKNFDVHGFPNVLIYNAKGELQKHFTGEVKIEAILKYLST